MRLLLGCTVLLGVLAGMPLKAADGASGRWTGVVVTPHPGSNEVTRTEVELDLTERSGAVEGRIGRKGDSERVVIRNGRASGTSVTFEAASAETAGPMRFTLVRSGDTLAGEMKGSTDDGEIVAKVELKRAKE